MKKNKKKHYNIDKIEAKAAAERDMKKMDEMYEKAITITEFRRHFSYYINKSQVEDVYITIHGRLVAKLSNPYK